MNITEPKVLVKLLVGLFLDAKTSCSIDKVPEKTSFKPPFWCIPF